MFNSNFCYDFCYDFCYKKYAKVTFRYYIFVVHVYIFHDYVLLFLDYCLAVPIIKILLSFKYVVSHISIIN